MRSWVASLVVLGVCVPGTGFAQSVASCGGSDIPGGWPSTTCGSRCTVTGGTVQCDAPSSLAATMYVTDAPSGVTTYDHLVFVKDAVNAYCCRVTAPTSPSAGYVIQLNGSTTGDTLDANGYSTLPGLTRQYLGTSSGLWEPQLQLFGWEGNDTIEGSNDTTGGSSAQPDVLFGGPGTDTINGNAGIDLIEGGADGDTLTGGPGNDDIYGAERNGVIDGDCNLGSGTDGGDWISGGDGNDRIAGCAGADTIHGQDGIDLLYGFDATTDCLSTVLNDGDDLILGGNGPDLIYGCFGDDHLIGDAGFNSGAAGWVCSADTLGLDGADEIHGSEGSDIISGCKVGDTIFGDAGNDFISGDNGPDTIEGGDDVDEISGGNQNDVLTGGFDDDFVLGDAGNDTICDGTEHDDLEGGDGDDTIYFDDSTLDVLDGGNHVNGDSCSDIGSIDQFCEFVLTSEPAACTTLTY